MDCNNFKSCIVSLENCDKKEQSCSQSGCLKSFDDRKKIVVEEKKKKYQLNNSKTDKVACFHVDGGMITSQDSIKCDNMLVDIDSKLAIFVELKGTDLKHALEQVNATLNKLLPGLSNYRIFARIVTSNRTNVPNIKTCPQYVTLSKNVMKNKGNIIIHANIIEDDVVNM